MFERGICGGRPDAGARAQLNIATHREVVTRELRELAELGLVHKDGAILHVTDIPSIERIVTEAKGS